MLQHIRSFVRNRRDRHISRQRETRYRGSPDFVELTYGSLLLSSFRPDRKLAGRFGEYSYSTWEGTAVFPFWRSELNVSLVIPDSRPQPPHLDALREALDQPVCIRNEVERAIFAYYCSIAYHPNTRAYHPSTRNIAGNDLRKPASAKQLGRLLGPPLLYLDYFGTRCDQRMYDLYFCTLWDEERDLRVRLRNWRVFSIGN